MKLFYARAFQGALTAVAAIGMALGSRAAFRAPASEGRLPKAGYSAKCGLYQHCGNSPEHGATAEPFGGHLSYVIGYPMSREPVSGRNRSSCTPRSCRNGVGDVIWRGFRRNSRMRP